ncbi:MAG: hypothetical protein QOG02_419 [Gaiellales bacterium]|jgi:SAM-dependent methyltransferase|nr:hypothetical protein [Gaiellales bacterium]
MGFSQRLIDGSGYAAEGFAQAYDEFRPSPAPAVLSILTMQAGAARPSLVIDLGCGTGLSSRAWSERAVRVVGVEGNPSMVAQARAATAAPNVEFAGRFAHDTGLAPAVADIVTCAQSFHWMEPGPVLAEAARLLRPRGVFAAYDYDVVPVIEPEVEAAFRAHVAARSAARRRFGIEAGATTWPKSGHLGQIEESGHFRYSREVHCHAEDAIDADRLVGLAQSIGPLALFDGADPEVEATLAALRETADRVLDNRVWPALRSYTIRLGVR